MAALLYTLIFVLFFSAVSIRCTNREPLNGESFHMSARSPRKLHRHLRQPPPNVTTLPQYYVVHDGMEDDTTKAVSTPWELQQKVNRILQLKQVSGTSIIALLCLALAFRNHVRLEYLALEELPIVCYPPMKLIMRFLVIANTVSGIALFTQPAKMKVFGKTTLAANVFNEALGMLCDALMIIRLFLLKKDSEAQLVIGNFLSHLFWASMVLSINRSRWISKSPRTTAPPSSRGSIPPSSHALNSARPQPYYPAKQ